MKQGFPYLHIISIKEKFRNLGIGKDLLNDFEKVVAQSSKVFLVKCIGGHTKGSSIVTFNCDMMQYILAGDECYLYESIDKEIPVGRSYDIEKSREFIKRYKESSNIILLCHEPDVVKGDIGYRTILPS